MLLKLCECCWLVIKIIDIFLIIMVHFQLFNCITKFISHAWYLFLFYFKLSFGLTYTYIFTFVLSIITTIIKTADTLNIMAKISLSLTWSKSANHRHRWSQLISVIAEISWSLLWLNPADHCHCRNQLITVLWPKLVGLTVMTGNSWFNCHGRI